MAREYLAGSGRPNVGVCDDGERVLKALDARAAVLSTDLDADDIALT